jgi:hypothetical protein
MVVSGMRNAKPQLGAAKMKRPEFLRSAIVLALVGVVFLVPTVTRAIQGEPLTWTPGVYTAVGLFLGAAISLVLRR